MEECRKAQVLKIIESCNADETGLFVRLPHNKTLSLKGNPCNGGRNTKKRVMVLLACSANRTDTLIISGKSENPQCSKVSESSPQNIAKMNVWVIQAIIMQYLGALGAKMSSQKRRILCFIDQSAALPQDTTSYQSTWKSCFSPKTILSL